MEPTRLEMDRLAWITGAGGLIGNYLLQTAPESAANWRVRGVIRPQLDLTDFHAVRKTFQKENPQLVIHCAALSQSPECQKYPELAHKLNVDVTAFLAELAAEIPFIFFSTDLVFDGRKGDYSESDTVNPLSVYAETKAAAERIVLANPKHTVIRTSLNGGISPTGDRGFNEQLRLAFERGQMLRLFSDEFRCPIPAIVTARAVWELAAREASGLFHIAGGERLSRWQMGHLIAARWPQFSPKLESGSLAHFQGAARSPDTSLNCSKAQRHLSFSLPGLRGWLQKHPDEMF
jgi:dTDP-4-dehydrorhamnose reductase